MNERQGSNLQIIEDRVMVAVPRGQRGEELRVSFVRAKTADGKEVAWHAIREFWRSDDGKMLPSKKGITLRGKELRPVLLALAEAAGARLVKANPSSREG